MRGLTCIVDGCRKSESWGARFISLGVCRCDIIRCLPSNLHPNNARLTLEYYLDQVIRSPPVSRVSIVDLLSNDVLLRNIVSGPRTHHSHTALYRCILRYG
jgi:hypothetical protein